MAPWPNKNCANVYPARKLITENSFWTFTINFSGVISVYPEHSRSEWITGQRQTRGVLLNHLRPHSFFLEEEMNPLGKLCSSAVILLTNKECPWRCLMCDLWKNTLPYTVPAGAIPQQIEYALSQMGSAPEQVKLYNSGSFFDPTAIPVSDYETIATKLLFAERVIVECHPRLVNKRAIAFKNLLNQQKRLSLEVAIGLETVHPDVLPRLNKRFVLEHFASAVRFLREHEISCRAFILVKPPFLTETEAVEWTVKSAEYAFNLGAAVVSIIPTRAGNGAMDRLVESGEFLPPRLSTIEAALESAMGLLLKKSQGTPDLERIARRVFVDTWNLEQFSTCSHCFEKRRLRLLQMNATQQILPAVDCSFCGSS
jgi:archaeosine synthase beta-subunit